MILSDVGLTPVANEYVKHTDGVNGFYAVKSNNVKSVNSAVECFSLHGFLYLKNLVFNLHLLLCCQHFEGRFEVSFSDRFYLS